MGNPPCGAAARSSGEPCKQPVVPGTNRCRFHGGAAKQVRAKGQLRLAEAAARELVETYGRKVETTAVEALLDEVQWTAGHVAWLRQQVAALEEKALVWGATQIKTGGQDGGITEAAEPNVWLRLYQQERTHLVKVCESAIRCGIEERRVRLAEAQGALVAQVIKAILADLQLTDEQLAKVPEIVPRHLRALALAA